MAAHRHSDALFRISYGIFSVKFVIFELVFFGLALYGLYELARHELGLNFSTIHSRELSAPSPRDTSVITNARKARTPDTDPSLH